MISTLKFFILRHKIDFKAVKILLDLLLSCSVMNRDASLALTSAKQVTLRKHLVNLLQVTPTSFTARPSHNNFHTAVQEMLIGCD